MSLRIDIANAFNTADFTVKPSYAFPNAVEAEELKLTRDDIERRVLIVDNQPESNELMRDSRGLIEAGRIMLFSITRRPKLAVEDMQSWLDLLYVSDLGGRSAQPNAPFDFNGVRFWVWRPFEPLNKTAEKFGSRFWIVDQLIDFAAVKI